MTPPPRCLPPAKKTVFSPTGFLTFMVTAVAAISNVVVNINNNNDLNNNNNNNDNVNNNNQAIDSDDVMNVGNARRMLGGLLQFDGRGFACEAKREAEMNQDEVGKRF